MSAFETFSLLRDGKPAYESADSNMEGLAGNNQFTSQAVLSGILNNPNPAAVAMAKYPNTGTYDYGSLIPQGRSAAVNKRLDNEISQSTTKAPNPYSGARPQQQVSRPQQSIISDNRRNAVNKRLDQEIAQSTTNMPNLYSRATPSNYADNIQSAVAADPSMLDYQLRAERSSELMQSEANDNKAFWQQSKDQLDALPQHMKSTKQFKDAYIRSVNGLSSANDEVNSANNFYNKVHGVTGVLSGTGGIGDNTAATDNKNIPSGVSLPNVSDIGTKGAKAGTTTTGVDKIGATPAATTPPPATTLNTFRKENPTGFSMWINKMSRASDEALGSMKATLNDPKFSKALMMFGIRTMAAASRPGANTFGSIAEGLETGLQEYYANPNKDTALKLMESSIESGILSGNALKRIEESGYALPQVAEEIRNGTISMAEIEANIDMTKSIGIKKATEKEDEKEEQGDNATTISALSADLEDVNALLDPSFDLDEITGIGEQYYPDIMRSSDNLVQMNRLNRIASNLTLERLELMKGTPSDKDAEIVRLAAGLDQTVEPETAKRNLERLRQLLRYKLSVKGVNTPTGGGTMSL